MSMKPWVVAIVGSRDYTNLGRIQEALADLQDQALIKSKRLVILSGGARGVDRTAELFARDLGIEVADPILPDWSKGSQAPLLRNTLIAEKADLILAFWDGVSGGTLDTMRKAKDMGKMVIVIRPDGEEILWNEGD